LNKQSTFERLVGLLGVAVASGVAATPAAILRRQQASVEVLG
jgi:hypothetical protein